jgi:NAD+ kinase
MKIRIFTKDDVICKEIARNLKAELMNENIDIDEEAFNYAISVGGDGTFLKMLRKCKFDPSINYIGINEGGLGFLTNLTPDEIPTFIEALKTDDLVKDDIPYLKIRVKSLDTKDDIILKALNEISIKSSNLGTTTLNVSVSGSYLESLVGDGLIVSTPLGSSAYNKSIGGPIVNKKLEALTITPIAPLNNNMNRSLTSSFVTCGTDRIDIVPTEESNDLIVSVDGVSYKLKGIESLEINLSEKRLPIYHLVGQDYIKKIYEKFVK